MFMRKFRTLLFRHGIIHNAIEAEQQRPSPDSIKLLRLKRLRLALKDQMHRLASATERADDLRLAPIRAVQRRPGMIPARNLSQ
jgi:hypothetical protein